MSHRPFRFVHAADLHLEQPLGGVADVPEQLRELCLEAGYLAAERIFEVVLAEEAELLILAGDALQPYKTGPRGPLFLAAQFERLRERGIPVYWAGGQVDPPEVWPSSMPLPDNVHVFPPGRPEEFTHEREKIPLVRLVGASRVRGRAVRAADFAPDPAGLYSIAVVHGNADADSLKAHGIDYWALGGNHARGTLFSAPRAAHYPGTPQGRRPDQAGPHGCTLVQVDDRRHTRLSFIPCDAMRWHNERVVVDEATKRNDLETRLHDRMQAVKEANPGTDLMVAWTIAGSGPILAQVRRGRLAGELLDGLRKEHGMGSPAAWSISLAAEAGAVLPPEWYEQDTICGDFLRQLRHYQMNPEEPIALDPYLDEEHRAGPLADAAKIADAAEHQRVLREAAMLGIDLLSGEEPVP